jgi:hypothetical protein
MSMKRTAILALLLLAVPAWAQTRGADGKWYDSNLVLQVVEETVQEEGAFTLCVAQKKEGRCVENLLTPFVVRVFNSAGTEIWNGTYTGMVPYVVFKKALPTAARMEIVAQKNFVINVMTGTRIYTEQPLRASYVFGK